MQVGIAGLEQISPICPTNSQWGSGDQGATECSELSGMFLDTMVTSQDWWGEVLSWCGMKILTKGYRCLARMSIACLGDRGLDGCKGPQGSLCKLSQNWYTVSTTPTCRAGSIALCGLHYTASLYQPNRVETLIYQTRRHVFSRPLSRFNKPL